MPTIEERVAYLEGRVSEQAQTLVEIRSRFDAIDHRFDAIDRRFDIVDRRFEAVDRRIEGLDDKVSRQFLWLVGMQVTLLVAVVGALLSRS